MARLNPASPSHTRVIKITLEASGRKPSQARVFCDGGPPGEYHRLPLKQCSSSAPSRAYAWWDYIPRPVTPCQSIPRATRFFVDSDGASYDKLSPAELATSPNKYYVHCSYGPRRCRHAALYIYSPSAPDPLHPDIRLIMPTSRDLHYPLKTHSSLSDPRAAVWSLHDLEGLWYSSNATGEAECIHFDVRLGALTATYLLGDPSRSSTQKNNLWFLRLALKGRPAEACRTRWRLWHPQRDDTPEPIRILDGDALRSNCYPIRTVPTVAGVISADEVHVLWDNDFRILRRYIPQGPTDSWLSVQ
ncbi:hypothetical protein C8Q76DRAFT_705327 [Earliella scabrosa]|nr:hypothetical protein C8Q76DRAFT_705327 [Earliella scabrosa]